MRSYKAACTAGWISTGPGGRAKFCNSTSWKYCAANLSIESVMVAELHIVMNLISQEINAADIIGARAKKSG